MFFVEFSKTFGFSFRSKGRFLHRNLSFSDRKVPFYSKKCIFLNKKPNSTCKNARKKISSRQAENTHPQIPDFQNTPPPSWGGNNNPGPVVVIFLVHTHTHTHTILIGRAHTRTYTHTKNEKPFPRPWRVVPFGRLVLGRWGGADLHFRVVLRLKAYAQGRNHPHPERPFVPPPLRRDRMYP